jgi:hypothetical protein
MNLTKIFAACLAVFAIVLSASASNITMSDGRTSTGYVYGSADFSYGANEDNEVEPGCYAYQQWDLEAFDLNGTTLSVIGGYDMKTTGYEGTVMGDIFVDVGGTPAYDYVYDINWNTLNYNLYSVSGGSLVNITMSPENTWNALSNPVSFNPGTSQLSLFSGRVTYVANKTNAQVLALTGENVTGGLHNIASLNVSKIAELSNGNLVTLHTTMSCGNDNLMGQTRFSVPEPGSFSMILMGFLSIAGFALSKKRK